MFVFFLTEENVTSSTRDCDIFEKQPFGNCNHSQAHFSLFYDCTDEVHDVTIKRYDRNKADYERMSGLKHRLTVNN